MIRLALCPILCLAFLAAPAAQPSAVGRVQQLAPDVYFYEGDISKGHCNNGWVVFEDYVLVIDANYPSGAREVIAKIRELTQKPVRFAFDTHHHGDHAYGNQVWVEQGATPVAHTAVLDEMKRLETGVFGDRPGRWENEAKNREDLRGSKLKPPTLLFPDTLIFDDGKHRVELRHFGTAHTKGDGVAWLPKEKIVFTGDMAVNGAYNFVGDGNVASWIPTLAKVAGLGPSKVGPGHGPLGDAAVIEDQALYFKELTAAVTTASTGQDGRGRSDGDSGDARRAREERAHHEVPRRWLRGARRQGLQRDHRRHAARSPGRARRGAAACRLAPRTCTRRRGSARMTARIGQDRDVRERDGAASPP